MNKKKLTGWGAALAAIAAAIVSLRSPHPKPVPVPVDPPAPTYTLVAHVCDGDCAADIKLPGAVISATNQIDVIADAAGNGEFRDLPAGDYTVCAKVDRFKTGCRDRKVPADGNEVFLALERDVPPIQALHVDGRYLTTDGTPTFRGLFVSGLTFIVRPVKRDAFLDQAVQLGLNGIRVFAGDLAWAAQTASGAEAALPDLLDAAAARGLRVFVSAVTDSCRIRDIEMHCPQEAYDVAAHLRATAAIVAAHPNALLEGANEPWDVEQADSVNDADEFARTAQRVIPQGLPYALGAPPYDEPQQKDPACTENCETWWPQPHPGGLVSIHLDRGRDLVNQVRRVREMAAASEAARAPVISGEPKGMADAPVGGKDRLTGDDAKLFAFAYGALCRGFEISICVLHTESGLQGEILGEHEQQDVREFVAGFHAIDTDDRLQFQNARWAGSPVADARFVDRYGQPGVVRAYSFVAGARGWTVLVGITGDPAIKWGSGWHPVQLAAERPGVQVWEIAR